MELTKILELLCLAPENRNLRRKMRKSGLSDVASMTQIDVAFKEGISYVRVGDFKLLGGLALAPTGLLFVIRDGKLKETGIRYEITHMPNYVITRYFHNGELIKETTEPMLGLSYG